MSTSAATATMTIPKFKRFFERPNKPVGALDIISGRAFDVVVPSLEVATKLICSVVVSFDKLAGTAITTKKSFDVPAPIVIFDG